MPIRILFTGNTTEKYVESATEVYLSRLRRYHKIAVEIISTKKGLIDVNQIKKSDGLQILSKLKKTDFVILLDETGQQYSSKELAGKIEVMLTKSAGDIVFVIGGAYGFDTPVYERANEKFALSKMTFTHQMVRLIFIEQLYRAFTIIRNENYHH